MPLTALKVRTAGPGRHADIHGLYLNVRPTGSRSWVLRMQFKGRRRDFGLGPVHDVSLAEARVAAAEVRKMVRAGLDPVKERGLTVLVVGEPVAVTANVNAPLLTVLNEALSESGNTGRPVSDWLMTDANGKELDLMEKVGAAGIVAGAMLLVSLKSGVTG